MNNKNFKIHINSAEYRDKVLACWIGKNIGGTMGAPYEGTHDVLDVKGFESKPGAPLPNDDLDLQLVWLHAAEKLGSRCIDSRTLGLFWRSFIVAWWNEYGVCQTNMKRGLTPPLCGDYMNGWRNSNGAWIRTEIWACLFPGAPEAAVKYSKEDASVDHGSGEGTVAAAFVAAMQSCAFTINDIRSCIELALDSIPEGSRTADTIRLAISCFDKKMPIVDARNLIQARNADMADGWFEAPSNVAYAILGLLYGEGDFKKSMLFAINCGDDTDCTAATVGATLGILGGTAAIPDDWRDYIGDGIITLALNRTGAGARLPKSCTELTDRVAALAPHMLFEVGAGVALSEGETVLPNNITDYYRKACENLRKIEFLPPYSAKYATPLVTVVTTLDSAPDIAPMDEKKIHITFHNNSGVFDAISYNLSFKWILPEGFRVSGKSSFYMKHNYLRSPKEERSLDFTITSGEHIDAKNKCILEITIEDTPELVYIPFVFFG